MQTIMRRHGIPGGALAVAKDGRLIFAKGFGWADLDKQLTATPETLFGLASLSKPIVTGVLRDTLHYDGVVVTDALSAAALGAIPANQVILDAINAGARASGTILSGGGTAGRPSPRPGGSGGDRASSRTWATRTFAAGPWRPRRKR